MQRELLELICCPACHRELQITALEYKEPEVWEGHLACSVCQKSYPIHRGLPYLYVNDDKWTSKAEEADGWVNHHKNLGIYEVSADPIDLKIPYYPQQPWINVARSFDIALEELNLTGEETILDLGAGRGWASKQFAMRGCRVVALDIVPDENIGLGRGRALMDDAGIYFDRIIGDGENLPFFQESFDLVFCAATLHHASNLGLLMENIGRVLKVNGRLCAINEPCLSVLEDETKVLARDAATELAFGINETRPDMIHYEHTLRQAKLMIILALPVTSYDMSQPALRHWVEEMGIIRPPFTPLAVRPMLYRFIRYLKFHLLAIKNGSFLKTVKLLSRYSSDNLAMAALVWTGGELFLVAKKLPENYRQQ